MQAVEKLTLHFVKKHVKTKNTRWRSRCITDNVDWCRLKISTLIRVPPPPLNVGITQILWPADKISNNQHRYRQTLLPFARIARLMTESCEHDRRWRGLETITRESTRNAPRLFRCPKLGRKCLLLAFSSLFAGEGNHRNRCCGQCTDFTNRRYFFTATSHARAVTLSIGPPYKRKTE